jgi:hypothetical protein
VLNATCRATGISKTTVNIYIKGHQSGGSLTEHTENDFTPAEVQLCYLLTYVEKKKLPMFYKFKQTLIKIDLNVYRCLNDSDVKHSYLKYKLSVAYMMFNCLSNIKIYIYLCLMSLPIIKQSLLIYTIVKAQFHELD